MSAGGAHLLVLANEKGGTGKSTVAAQVAIAAARRGWRVAALDLDHRQRTFGRIMENRAISRERLSLELPMVRTLTYDPGKDRDIVVLLDRIGADADLVIVDTPGRHDMVSLVAIGRADTLITPLNDSLVDLDLFGQVSPDTHEMKRPSFYTRLIWDVRREREARNAVALDWVVTCNRRHHLGSRNSHRVMEALKCLSFRAGFRVVPGLKERVCYKELFPEGLSPLDLPLCGNAQISAKNAQQEIEMLFASLRINPRFDSPKSSGTIKFSNVREAIA